MTIFFKSNEENTRYFAFSMPRKSLQSMCYLIKWQFAH